jgi:hypothetical protein
MAGSSPAKTNKEEAVNQLIGDFAAAPLPDRRRTGLSNSVGVKPVLPLLKRNRIAP